MIRVNIFIVRQYKYLEMVKKLMSHGQEHRKLSNMGRTEEIDNV